MRGPSNDPLPEIAALVAWARDGVAGGATGNGAAAGAGGGGGGAAGAAPGSDKGAIVGAGCFTCGAGGRIGALGVSKCGRQRGNSTFAIGSGFGAREHPARPRPRRLPTQPPPSPLWDATTADTTAPVRSSMAGQQVRPRRRIAQYLAQRLFARQRVEQLLIGERGLEPAAPRESACRWHIRPLLLDVVAAHRCFRAPNPRPSVPSGSCGTGGKPERRDRHGAGGRARHREESRRRHNGQEHAREGAPSSTSTSRGSTRHSSRRRRYSRCSARGPGGYFL